MDVVLQLFPSGKLTASWLLLRLYRLPSLKRLIGPYVLVIASLHCDHQTSRGQHQDLDACDGHNSSSSGSGGGPFSSFTRSPHRLFVRDLSGAQETAFEPLRLHLKPVSEGEEEAQPTSSDN